jgi:hypothetical protein
MGSVRGHPFWLSVLSNIFSGNTTSSVVFHTGPGQLANSFRKTLARYPAALNGTYLVPSNVIANRAQCGECSAQVCVHEHDVSPSEI